MQTKPTQIQFWICVNIYLAAYYQGSEAHFSTTPEARYTQQHKHSNIKPSVFTTQGQYCAKSIKGWDLKYWNPFSPIFFLQDRESIYVAQVGLKVALLLLLPPPNCSQLFCLHFFGDSHWKEKPTLWQDLNKKLISDKPPGPENWVASTAIGFIDPVLLGSSC